MDIILIQLIRIISWVVIIQVLVSWILPPYHSVRQALDQIVEPLLDPIRRIMPDTGMVDFSPLVFLLLLQFIAQLIINLL